MDALSSPIQFLTQAEKRLKQLQQFGIEESDIADPGVVCKSQGGSKSQEMAANGSIPNSVTMNSLMKIDVVEKKGKSLLFKHNFIYLLIIH